MIYVAWSPFEASLAFQMTLVNRIIELIHEECSDEDFGHGPYGNLDSVVSASMPKLDELARKVARDCRAERQGIWATTLVGVPITVKITLPPPQRGYTISIRVELIKEVPVFPSGPSPEN